MSWNPIASAGRLLCAAAAVAVFNAPPAVAQVSHSLSPATARMSAQDFATIMATATPMENLVDSLPAALLAPGAAPVAGAMVDAPTPLIHPGRLGAAARTEVISPLPAAPTGTQRAGVAPQNYGVNNLDTIYHYNDSLQIPTPIYEFPHRAIGKLFFSFDDVSWFSCTAALINYTLLVTAGHCVHQGGNESDGWLSQGYFVPAYSAARGVNQFAGRCDILHASTTSEWFTEGLIENGYDVGMLLCGRLFDAAIGRYANSWPGYRLGFLGFCYANCRWGYQFLTQLGYPTNYYAAGEMTVSQHLESTVNGAATPDYVYGSGMRGGSSGGPHIANIGEISDSSSNLGQWTNRNTIFAVTSWGYTSDIYKIQGASPLSGVANGNNFVGLYNEVCRASRRTTGLGASSCSLLPE